MSYTIKIEGGDTLMQLLKDIPKKKLQDVEDEFEAYAFELNTMQKGRAPKDEGSIVQAITNIKTAPLTWEIVCQKIHAVWNEFGTKSKARIPAGLEGVASQFRGVGLASGTNARQSIYEWCRRHGIEKRAWYLIYREIVTNGIKPHPFFYGPYFETRGKFIERIKNVLVA